MVKISENRYRINDDTFEDFDPKSIPIVKKILDENCGGLEIRGADYWAAHTCIKCKAELFYYFRSAFITSSNSIVREGGPEADKCNEQLEKAKPGITCPKDFFKRTTTAECPRCHTVWEGVDKDYVRQSYEFGKDKEEHAEFLYKRDAEIINCSNRKLGEEKANIFIKENQEIIADNGATKKLDGTDELLAFLGNLIKIENSIYSLECHLPDAMGSLEVLQPKVIADKCDAVNKYLEMKNQAEDDYNEIKNKKYDEEITLTVKKGKLSKPVIPQKPDEPVYKKPGLFNKKKIDSENEQARMQYETALEIFNSDMAAYDKELVFYNDEQEELKKEAEAEYEARLSEAKKLHDDKVEKARLTVENAQKEYDVALKNAEPSEPVKVCEQMYEKDINDSKETLLKLYEARNKMYSTGVIYSKYWSLPALTTFYEYLMSGRCELLEGPSGAYNLYENELRSNIIIAELGTIINQLEEIKQNQYMLYNEMKSMGASLRNMENSMDKVVASLDRIEANTEMTAHNTEMTAYNTAATAYYSKINADLTNALGYLIAMK